MAVKNGQLSKWLGIVLAVLAILGTFAGMVYAWAKVTNGLNDHVEDDTAHVDQQLRDTITRIATDVDWIKREIEKMREEE